MFFSQHFRVSQTQQTNSKRTKVVLFFYRKYHMIHDSQGEIRDSGVKRTKIEAGHRFLLCCLFQHNFMSVFFFLFRCAVAPLWEPLSFCRSVGRSENPRKCLKSHENSSRSSFMLLVISFSCRKAARAQERSDRARDGFDRAKDGSHRARDRARGIELGIGLRINNAGRTVLALFPSLTCLLAHCSVHLFAPLFIHLFIRLFVR